jgi:hypothetical protein
MMLEVGRSSDKGWLTAGEIPPLVPLTPELFGIVTLWQPS